MACEYSFKLLKYLNFHHMTIQSKSMALLVPPTCTFHCKCGSGPSYISSYLHPCNYTLPLLVFPLTHSQASRVQLLLANWAASTAMVYNISGTGRPHHSLPSAGTTFSKTYFITLVVPADLIIPYCRPVPHLQKHISLHRWYRPTLSFLTVGRYHIFKNIFYYIGGTGRQHHSLQSAGTTSSKTYFIT